ncbi:MAG: hypothetical protein ABSC06_29340 [Rhodopila sp.]|jgi:hypothetical protein
MHFCFAAALPASVDAFHDVARRMGGKENGWPVARADYGPCYAAFVINPDFDQIEAHHGG